MNKEELHASGCCLFLVSILSFEWRETEESHEQYRIFDSTVEIQTRCFEQ
jgi:hypothetical protein